MQTVSIIISYWIIPVVFGIIHLMKKGMAKTKKVKKQRKHGFLARMATHDGRKVIKRRRLKNRSSLAV